MRRNDITVNEVTIMEQVKGIVSTEVSKSTKMKQLFDLGLDIKDIAEIMQVRYNFVYNVVSNYVNINDIPVSSTPGESKKGLILEMFKSGKTNKEIAKELKLNYNYIYKVIREFNEQQTTGNNSQQVPQQQAVGQNTTVITPPEPVIQQSSVVAESPVETTPVNNTPSLAEQVKSQTTNAKKGRWAGIFGGLIG